MEQIKELTKRLIANSFKELMLQTPFEKITIKMITDHASVIRPTFYNHFHDKYDLVEWILCAEILDEFSEKILEGQVEDAVSLLFTGFFQEKEYYIKAFEIGGQNGFRETLAGILRCIFSSAYKNTARDGVPGPLDGELLGQYYADGLITTIWYEMKKAPSVTAQEALNEYNFIMNHNIYNLYK